MGNIVPLGNPEVWLVVTPEQLSVPTGGVKVTTAPHCPASFVTLIFAGHAMTGNSMSFTVTVKEQVLTLFDASVAVNVCVVTPTGKVAPLAKPAVWVVTAPEQLSVPTGATNVTTAPQIPGVELTAMLAGQAITGGSASSTVTVKEQEVTLLEASVAVNVCVVTPTGKVAPLAKPAVCVVTTAQLSVPTGGLNVTAAPQRPGVVFTEMLAGQAMTGNSMSFTVTVKEQDVTLLEASVAVNVCVVTPTGKVAPLARPAV
jgi:hypothetical protein